MDKHLTAIIVFDLLITIILLAFYYFKPKEINPLYGYRTKRSMRNQASWDYAQDYCSKWWLLILPVMFSSQIVLLLGDIPLRMIGYLSLLEFIVGSAAVIYATEHALKKFQEREPL